MNATFKGLAAMGNFLGDAVMNSLKCNESLSDYEKMSQFFLIFADVNDFDKYVHLNLKAHEAEALQVMEEAIKEWEAEKYYKFGVKIGVLMIIAFQQDKIVNPTQSLQFLSQ